MIIIPFAYMAEKAVVPSWTPADFTDVKYWWTADAGVTESGGNVTAWEDQIAGFTLTGVNNPQLTTSATLNGENVIAFNGTNNYIYSTTAPSSQTAGADLTMLSVVNLIDVKTGGTFMGAVLIGPGDRWWVDTLSGNIRVFNEDYPSAGTAVDIESPATAGAKVIKLRYDSSAGDGYYAIDTLTESTFATGGTTGTFTWAAGTTVAMGATLSNNGGSVFSSRYVQVEVAEQVWIEGTPSSAEMDEWMAYVNAKYGTTVETLPPALAAYSLRKLYDNYAGSAIEVTRASDLATQDIGFDSNGDLDTTSLLSFVGASTGYVSKWYDQSGNANDQVQASVGAMPWIVDTGTLVTQGGLPAIDFPGNDYFSRSNIINTIDNKTTFNVYYPTNVATSDCIMDLSSASGPTGTAWTLTSEIALRCVSRTYVTTAGVSNTYSLLEMWQDGITIDDANQFKMYLNGTYIPRASGANGNLVSGTSDFNIGYSPNGGNYFDGTQQEIIIFDSALTDSARETVRDNINAYYSVYP